MNIFKKLFKSGVEATPEPISHRLVEPEVRPDMSHISHDPADPMESSTSGIWRVAKATCKHCEHHLNDYEVVVKACTTCGTFLDEPLLHEKLYRRIVHKGSWINHVKYRRGLEYLSTTLDRRGLILYIMGDSETNPSDRIEDQAI